jgi:hypothetical protein
MKSVAARLKSKLKENLTEHFPINYQTDLIFSNANNSYYYM